MYKDHKGTPPDLAQHKMKLNTFIPPTHEAKYMMNLHYDVLLVKQHVDKLFAIRFIQVVEEAPQLFLVAMVLKKNGKIQICVNFQNLI